MRLHQVLTGAANLIEDSVAVAHGNVSGFPFTVYGSGFEIVILDSHFNRVQIISSHGISNSSIVKCMACSCRDGKIAVSFGRRIVLLKPQSLPSPPETKLPFQWKKISSLDFGANVTRLCWDQEGKRLLVGSDSLYIWRKDYSHREKESDDKEDSHEVEKWISVWQRKLARPAKFLEFSPDGHYFGSASQGDRMIKIWFRAPKVDDNGEKSPQDPVAEHYNFIYILHPAAVQSLSWRKISPHMPLCSVPNVLLTSCSDNVCRIWAETVKYKPSHHNVKSRTDSTVDQTEGQMIEEEKIQVNQRYHLVSMFHFHLAAVINPSADIALLSMMPSSIFGRSFQLQWLNNKEVQLTTAVEAIFASLRSAGSSNNLSDRGTKDADPFLIVDDLVDGIDVIETMDEDLIDENLDEADTPTDYELRKDALPAVNELEQLPTTGIPTTYQGQLNNLIHEWCQSSDTLYCIHPADGSLLIWVIDYLDDFKSAYYRQVQVSFASRIPATFSKADASSLCWTHTYHYTQPVQRSFSPDIDSFFIKNAAKYIKTHNNLMFQNASSQCEHLTSLQVSFMVSAHADGSLNLWLVTFSESGSFAGIASITHVTRSCGPRFEITQLVSHPVLPLIIGTSLRSAAADPQRRASKASEQYRNVADIDSELILWHTSHISPLSEFKGVTEMARISSPNPREFSSLAWVPVLYHHSLLSITNDSIELLPNTPCTCFVAASSSGLHFYQILLDAKGLISNLSHQSVCSYIPNGSQCLRDFIDSEQSGSDSACIMKICTLDKSECLPHLKFLHVYDEKSFVEKSNMRTAGCSVNDLTCHYNSFYVVAIYEEGNKHMLFIWSITVSFDSKFVTSQPLDSPDSFVSDNSATTPASTPKPFILSHCLKQTLIYEDFLPTEDSSVKLFASAASLHSSTNLNPSCPVRYNFISTNDEGGVKFWDISVSDENVVSVTCLDTLCDLSNHASQEILSISCASADKFAYITKERTDNDHHRYLLYIKENQSSGELVWSTDTCIQVLETLSVDEHSIVKLVWMSLENGSYLLSVVLNNVVYVYSQRRTKIIGNSKIGKYKYDWQILKEIKTTLKNERVTTISWSNGCFFMIGVENEIQVYSQWANNKEVVFRHSPLVDHATLNQNSEQCVILTENSFSMACEAMRYLPQYHPDHLMALLNLGKLRRVRAILRHLVRCVAGPEAADSAADEESSVCEGDQEDYVPPTPARTRQRSLSRSYSVTSDGHEIDLVEPVDTGTDIDVIPPLMLTSLYAADKDERGKIVERNVKSVMDHNHFDQTDFSDPAKTNLSQIKVYFGLSQSALLTEHLSRKQLPGLSSQEQMYLIALSDTVASTTFDLERTDTAEMSMKYSKGDESSGYSTISGGGGGYATTGATGVNSLNSDTIDDCGLRFLLLMRHHIALIKSLPPWQRAPLLEKGMLPSEYCWAFHSECKEELLAMIPGMQRNEPKWSELKSYGVGWWVRSNDLLRRTMEKVAKTHFQATKDPLDCALFYLAMKKKTLICALYRSLRDTKMTTFFNNDFTQERWRKAALKNAYALLGKQRFEHAVAFFLLGNALWDAVQVCINRLNDLQLALVITRLYENDFEQTHNRVIETYVLGYHTEPLHEDPFIRSVALWIMKEYAESLEVLLVPVQSEDMLKKVDDYDYPSIFSFYYYLRSHPLLRRCCYSQRKPFEKRKMTFLNDGIYDAATLKEATKKYERKLYFQTAITHLNAGLPSLAFEVLSMLPEYYDNQDNDARERDKNKNIKKESDMINTGTIAGDFGNSSTPSKLSEAPICNGGTGENASMGWGYGLDASISTNRFGDLDEEYKIGITLSDSDDESDTHEEIESPVNGDTKINSCDENFESPSLNSEKLREGNNMYDIIALNLKYMCIIQCIIEELKALPAKCTQENKKLRSSLSVLLLGELYFLHQYCDYGGEKSEEEVSPGLLELSIMQQEVEDLRHQRRAETVSSIASFDLSAEELSLSEKVEKVAIHSEWLKKNQPILTSLYEHCMMVGSGDADLPAVCLELLFLLHEINDHRVLTAPLTAISAGPSAPPLLLASMTSFSLVASPTQFLRSMSHDLLQTVIDLPVLCTPANPVTRLADLENLMYSLSSCIYHSLCGGEEDKLLSSIRRGETEIVGKQMKNGKLVRLPYGAQDVELDVTSLPSQWPGVKFFLSILTASNKDSSHNLKLLLCEVAVAVYLSMFVSACSRLACNTLYRFVSNGLTEDMWNVVFGGGTKIVVPAPPNLGSHSGVYSLSSQGMSPTSLKLSPNLCPVVGDKKQDPTRMKWNYKLLGKKASEAPDEGQKLFRHEIYIPPLKSLCDYILQKPQSSFNYDSDVGESDDEDDSDGDDDIQLEDSIDDDGITDEKILEQRKEEQRKRQSKLEEHFDCCSYPWLIMQLSLLKVLSINLSSFLVMAGLDISDLPTQSPLLYNATKVLVRWEQLLTARLETYPVTESLIEYVPTPDEDGVTRGGMALQRTKVLLNQENTPFSTRGKNVMPAKRLWYSLVQQEQLRPIFLHYGFKSSQYSGIDETDFEVISGRILHKDPEPVTSFAINRANLNYLAISTAHEIIEYDICSSLDNDLFGMGDTSIVPEMESVDTMKEHKTNSHENCTPKVIQRRPCSGIRRMDSHPHLPYYVTGGADGSVRMFEFLHPDQIAQFRGAGQNDRVNKIHFNALGNKFAVVDDSGYLTMWLITNTQDSTPFLTLRCHTKCCLDFVFLGSSSLLATVGFTNDKRNICIWDTLLPPKKALVHTFSHNIHGAHSLVYVAGQHCLVSGGKRGDICIFDVRQRRLLHTFQAHPTVIKVLALDPTEMFFASGSADGDIKIWGLATHELFESFPKEHSRTTVSLRHHSPGVQCLMAVNGGQLFSCGGDGTLKWRLLKIKTSGEGL